MSKYIDVVEYKKILHKEVDKMYKFRSAEEIEQKPFDSEKVKAKTEAFYCAILKAMEMPSADVVEVVRCKDCKYYKSVYESYKELPDYYPTEDDKHNGRCNHTDGLGGKIHEDNFCSKAKRRETE